MPDESIQFHARRSTVQVEEGTELAPKFDDRGLIPAVTTDASSGELLMQGYMNAEALRLTISTGEAHYFYRRIPLGKEHQGKLVFTDTEKVFDPEEVYGDAPNPTVL